MLYNDSNFDNLESHLFFPGTTLEDCYASWSTETITTTSPWLTSSLHSPNKIGMIESFTEFWI